MPYFAFLLAFLYLTPFPVGTGKKLLSSSTWVLMPNIHEWKQRKLQPPQRAKKLLGSNKNTPIMLTAKLEYKRSEETDSRQGLRQAWFSNGNFIACYQVELFHVLLPQPRVCACQHTPTAYAHICFTLLGWESWRTSTARTASLQIFQPKPSSSTAESYGTPAGDT